MLLIYWHEIFLYLESDLPKQFQCFCHHIKLRVTVLVSVLVVQLGFGIMAAVPLTRTSLLSLSVRAGQTQTVIICVFSLVSSSSL